jgi:hypothetical protein
MSRMCASAPPGFLPRRSLKKQTLPRVLQAPGAFLFLPYALNHRERCAAALYEAPFEYANENVRLVREKHEKPGRRTPARSMLQRPLVQ